MRPKPLLLPVMALLAGAAAPAGGDATWLASISGLDMAPGEYVESFSIDTWGVRILAICNIPPGWEITAGGGAAQDGVIAGGGGHGVAFLDRARLGELRDLAIVRLDGAITTAATGSSPAIGPPTFSGVADIGAYGSERSRKQRLDHTNVSLTPAAACPALRPR